MPLKPCQFWSQESLFLLLSNTDSTVWILAQKISQKGVAIVPEEGEREQINGENSLLSNSQSPPPQTPIILYRGSRSAVHTGTVIL